MSDLVGTQIVGFVTHRLNYRFFEDLKRSQSLVIYESPFEELVIASESPTFSVIYGTLFYNPDKTKTLAQAKNLCEKGSRGSLAKIDDATDYQRVINFLKQQS